MEKCKNCGGVLKFDPTEKGNVCERCSSVFPVEYKYRFAKKNINNIPELKVDSFANSLKTVRCKHCGSNILIRKLQVKTNCPYCDNQDIIEERAKNLNYIDSIIPFAFDEKTALNKFRRHLIKAKFSNKKMFNDLIIEDVKSLYINSFVFDFNTNSKYAGVMEYTTKEKDSEGREYSVRRKKNVSGNYSKTFLNLSIEANSHLTQNKMEEILPFNFSDAIDFRPDFMNGYMLEYQDETILTSENKAKIIAENKIKHDLLDINHCDKIVSLTLNTEYSNEMYNYILLPVYFIRKRYKDKEYTILLNGQTGKIGEMPLSIWKIMLAILCSVALIVLIVILFAVLT